MQGCAWFCVSVRSLRIISDVFVCVNAWWVVALTKLLRSPQEVSDQLAPEQSGALPVSSLLC